MALLSWRLQRVADGYGLFGKYPIGYEGSHKEDKACELFKGYKYIFEVGSVGLRRELIVQGDNPSKIDHKASYSIFDGQNVTYRKIAYDIDSTIAKVRAMEFAPMIIARLVAQLTI